MYGYSWPSKVTAWDDTVKRNAVQYFNKSLYRDLRLSIFSSSPTCLLFLLHLCFTSQKESYKLSSSLFFRALSSLQTETLDYEWNRGTQIVAGVLAGVGESALHITNPIRIPCPYPGRVVSTRVWQGKQASPSILGDNYTTVD